MELVEVRRIPEIDKTYCKTIKIVCDRCNEEIKEKELYLSVNYHKERYEEELSYKHFCKNCIKESMYEMFMNNYYTNFDKYNFYKDDEWHECDEYDFERFGYKIVKEENK